MDIIKSEFTITEKRCPLCRNLKNIEEFDKYFSKKRQKYRPQSYCKLCSKEEKARRSKEYYQTHKKERIKYAKEYALRPENIEKNHQQRIESKRRRRENLSSSYVRDLMVQKFKFKNSDLLENPDLVLIYANKIKLKRTIKKIKYGKK
ncbi:hypothetical protein ACFO4P_16915 [Epilithonimonas pallida]|uniref:Uncharacterized protein n=1 Tax=Epilithonimonas pallida TaxID=373671 RepID=A0ABY1R543_9FLAO|nr:hypothetical protein [Epilithonimonas pallida]SMP94665.1 hypothetical protein SAMN05421679_10668 [Epilithonimonas pallida]